MRIVAGSLRGRSLVAPKGHSTRPTTDRAREAMFNVLEHAPWSTGLRDAQAVDLFAGSGALGLEALSRGAASCLFVDNDQAAVAAISRNIQSLGLGGQATVRAGDATTIAAGTAFDLALIDPPYAQGLAERAVSALSSGHRLAVGGIVVVEQGAGEAAFTAPGFVVLDARAWGAARVSFLQFRDESGR
ncbi:MAG TPA: 16S rRNA (guanine(966)-N(2))-methyltransferase RsmD [Caulobacteraceae bacterium]